ncbi:GNAT family N-acetyltransferase [Leptolyngbya iicbica]|uniref:GNAT family N-acetyltransferase n=2 Tax=Cyanophyceae TaxID=3028117 RepID=A0A4Q7EMD1_9CYAN|nr:GNAT family N-acetyltransferase [Leptolyngbya sp. LK]RZM82969.1 GNAT family N-acetyltransferase [Leptolyngbya sp. LK]
MKIPLTTWYLEMRSPADLRPKRANLSGLVVQQAAIPSPEFSRFLYTSVGGHWYWRDRLPWTYDQWLAHLNRPELETWVAYLSGTPAGYCELITQPDQRVKIEYFGLLPQFIAQGIGGHLLTCAIERAWELTHQRVWLHTCSLDSQHAYKNYEARGFTRYKTEKTVVLLPAESPGPWPNAAAPAPPIPGVAQTVSSPTI